MNAFDNILGYKEIKEELIKICDILKNKNKYEKLGVTIPKGLILIGPPGVGKTLMAKSLMSESQRNQFIIRKKKSDGDFLNEITDTFKEAKEKVPSIILLDDIDKFSEDKEDESNSDSYVAVQSCIDDYKNDDIFVVATCNESRTLPDSLIRSGRFDIRFEIEPPEDDGIEEIIRHYLKNKNCSKDINTKELSKLLTGYSCATLESLVNKGGMIAGFKNKEVIEMEDLIEAMLEDIFGSPKSLKRCTAEESEIYSLHEAGHAVISEILYPNSVHLVTIRAHSGSIGGFTFCEKPTNYKINQKAKANRAMIFLGGKAATEIVRNEIDTGTSRDLDEASHIIYKYCSSIGSFGFDKLYYPITNSEFKYRDINESISLELERLYKEAKFIIANNMDFLMKIKNELMQKETLSAEDIERIKKTCKICKYQ